MDRRVLVWLVTPLLAVGTVFFGSWAIKGGWSRTFGTLASRAPVEETAPAKALDPTFTLEVRGLGITVDKYRQRALLNRLDEVGVRGTLLSQEPKDYEWSSGTRRTASSQREGNVFEYALRGWMEFWPIPVILAGPPRDENDPHASHMRNKLTGADQKAGLAHNNYIVLDALHTDRGDSVLQTLFDFFDKHPDLPAATVLIEDGLLTRAYMRTPGGDARKESVEDGQRVPSRPDSYVALVVSRKDRVDRTIRPYVVQVTGSLDFRDTQYSVIRFWNYFWKSERSYRDIAKGNNEMPWDYWHKLLPEFWASSEDRGPGEFKPNPWVPVRWTDWQMREYDDAPLIGYLHRPIAVDLSNGDGEPAKKAIRVARLKDGWAQALATLSGNDKPERLFFDPGKDPAAWALVTQALYDNPHHIDLDDPNDAFNMATRIGDTGISSSWVQIAMALMRGYGDGKTSAAMDVRDPLHASIIMVTPPDEAWRKQHRLLFSYQVSQ